MKWSDYIGRRFRAFGGEYECVEYNSRIGFRMVLTGGTDEAFNRKPGDETWISERAIGRTYHEVT